MNRYEDDDDRPVYGSGGSFKVPDRDFYRRNFQCFSSTSNYLERQAAWNVRSNSVELPHFSSAEAVLPPYASWRSNPAISVCPHFLRRGFTKPTKTPFICAVWSSDARWLVLGTQTGDLALWEAEGLKVNKIVSVPAHKEFTSDGERIKEQFAICAMAWKRFDNLLVTGDSRGVIQYCDETFRNVFLVREGQGHQGAVRSFCFSPLDTKLCSAGDDGRLLLWSVGSNRPDSALLGHQSEVKSCDWHPSRGLLASASRDSTVKLWDPRVGRALATITAHKKAVNCVAFNGNGHWLASGSTDGLVRVFDLRVLREVEVLRGQQTEVTKLAWHPHAESLLVSGGYTGSLAFWLVDCNAQMPHSLISDAHRQSVDLLEWHPGGQLLASASHDSILKFWSREPPGSRAESGPAEAGREFHMENPPVVHWGPLRGDQLPRPTNTYSLPSQGSGQARQRDREAAHYGPSAGSAHTAGGTNSGRFPGGFIPRKRARGGDT
eukprot:gene32783-39636_t